MTDNEVGALEEVLAEAGTSSAVVEGVVAELEAAQERIRALEAQMARRRRPRREKTKEEVLRGTLAQVRAWVERLDDPEDLLALKAIEDCARATFRDGIARLQGGTTLRGPKQGVASFKEIGDALGVTKQAVDQAAKWTEKPGRWPRWQDVLDAPTQAQAMALRFLGDGQSRPVGPYGVHPSTAVSLHRRGLVEMTTDTSGRRWVRLADKGDESGQCI
jgi:hypothetical protein